MNSMPEARSREDLVKDYKTLLRQLIDLRPSGTRQKIAEALGKHKSFVSQITNPAYPVPIPAGDVPVIVQVCHLSPSERQKFLAAYAAAHPSRTTGTGASQARKGVDGGGREIVISLPELNDPELEQYLEETIRQTARRLIGLATRRSAKK